jgi:hypothetical protein
MAKKRAVQVLKSKNVENAIMEVWGYSQGEPPFTCSGAKAASTIPVAGVFGEDLEGT